MWNIVLKQLENRIDFLNSVDKNYKPTFSYQKQLIYVPIRFNTFPLFIHSIIIICGMTAPYAKEKSMNN
jgi:hypothetical protein